MKRWNPSAMSAVVFDRGLEVFPAAAARFVNVLWPVLLATSLFSVLLLVVGRSPLATVVAILHGAFGGALAIQETLTRTTPILLCALATAVPARAGLTNIGAEGQLYMGAIGASAVAIFLPSLPPIQMLSLMTFAAIASGAFMVGIAGILRATIGVNEVLVGLMLNYVGLYFVEFLVHGPWKDASAMGWPYSAVFPAAARLPTLGTSNIHIGLGIGIVAAILLTVLWRSTRWGFAIRVLEDNPVAARFVGINAGWYFVALLALGGMFAAIAGLGEVSVIQGRLRSGLSPGYGYAGFVVSWLAGHRFLAVVPIAFLVGGFYSGADALQLNAALPSATADIFLALLFLAFLMRSITFRRKLRSA
jgi:general nucleoside transport system permease protein